MQVSADSIVTVDLLVVGAGPAGLAAAVEASSPGRRVLLVEKGSLPGRKMMLAGFGRCAISRPGIDHGSLRGRYTRFAADLFRRVPTESLLIWLADLGVEVEPDADYGFYKPSEGGAGAILAMVEELERRGGELRCGVEIVEVRPSPQGLVAHCAGGGIAARRVVLAAGGPHLPQLGGGMRGLEIAEALGHRIEPATPALTGLQAGEGWAKRLPGLWMTCDLRLLADEKAVAEASGDVLFTRAGLTGQAVLDLSREVDPLLQSGASLSLAVNFFPGRSREEVGARLHHLLGEHTRMKLEYSLDRLIPQRLALELLAACRLKPDWRPDRLGARERERFLELLVDSRIPVTGTLGWRAAEAFRGGVAVRELDPKTFASRCVPGLYIVGDMPAVDPVWGGAGVHFALASGILAGRAISGP